jgi:Tfp pilus assembly protein PilF
MSENRRQVARRFGLTRSDSQAYYERGLESFAAEDFENAILDLNEAILHDGRRAELYTARGMIYKTSGQRDKAEADFQQALKLNRRQWMASYGLGVLAFDRAEWGTALDWFTKSLTVAPGHPEAWYHRAVTYHNMGEDGKALADMQTALRWFKDSDKRRNDANKWIKDLTPALKIEKEEGGTGPKPDHTKAAE